MSARRTDTVEPLSDLQRWGAEMRSIGRARLVELALAIGAVLTVLTLTGRRLDAGLTVVAIGLVWAAVYLGSCALFPLRNCWRCEGTGQPRTGDGQGNWRDRTCRRCKGGREQRRWGARLLGRGAPDRHDAKP